MRQILFREELERGYSILSKPRLHLLCGYCRFFLTRSHSTQRPPLFLPTTGLRAGLQALGRPWVRCVRLVPAALGRGGAVPSRQSCGPGRASRGWPLCLSRAVGWGSRSSRGPGRASDTRGNLFYKRPPCWLNQRLTELMPGWGLDQGDSGSY